MSYVCLEEDRYKDMIAFEKYVKKHKSEVISGYEEYKKNIYPFLNENKYMLDDVSFSMLYAQEDIAKYLAGNLLIPYYLAENLSKEICWKVIEHLQVE